MGVRVNTMFKFNAHPKSCLIAFALCASASAVPARAQEVSAGVAAAKASAAPAPEKRSPIRVTRFESQPVIDGRLDDEVWKGAARLADFYQIRPGDNTAPSKPTEVYIGYDAKTLYVAFRAADEAGKVRATVAKRDDVFGDDNVRIFLDTFNDRRKAYVLGFNPLGIQQDGIITEGGGTDYSVDVVMESKGTIDEAGGTVEVAVPFKSLRYEAGRGKVWGVHAWRNIDRLNDEMDSWMPISRDESGFLNQAGRITGLEGISTERTLELIPSLTISETGKRVSAPTTDASHDPGRFVNRPVGFDPGLNLKLGITPAITLDLAVNPDFAQVEADQTVVTANQRFPVFYAEKRPFFLEGIEIFRTPINAVHTRAIIDPDFAAKLTGRRGAYTFGLLLASDAGPGNFSEEERAVAANARLAGRNAGVGVLRVKRDVGAESSVGLIATSYNFIDRRNQLGGFDGRFKLDRQTTFTFQVLGTHSRRFFRDPDLAKSVHRTGNAFRYYFNLDRTGRNFGYTLWGTGQTRDYRADVGFTQRTNTNYHELHLRYSSDPDARATFVNWTVNNWLYTRFDWQGRSQGRTEDFSVGFNFRRQTSVNVAWTTGYERVFEEEFGNKRAPGRAGAFAGLDPERSVRPSAFYLWGGTSPSRKYRVTWDIDYTRGAFDFDFGGGPRFPRVSPSALLDPDAALDPGAGNQLNFRAGFRYQPTQALLATLDYTKSRLVRRDTRLTAYEDDIYALRATYQFTRFTFARARVDYSSLNANVRGQFLLGWTPNPGTSLYVGYNDDVNVNGHSPFTELHEPGLHRNGRTFFVKMSYLFRRSL